MDARTPLWTISVLLVSVAALATTGSPAAEPAQWRTVERCAAADVAAPGKGYFKVRYLTRGVDAEAIEIRGCGANRAYRKVIKWGGDAGVIEVYAVPFFDKRRRDLLVMHGLDTDSTYYLFTAASNYEKDVIKFSAIDAPYFGDGDNDGRWEVRVENLESLECRNGKKWGADLVLLGRTTLEANTLCNPPVEEPHL